MSKYFSLKGGLATLLLSFLVLILTAEPVLASKSYQCSYRGYLKPCTASEYQALQKATALAKKTQAYCHDLGLDWAGGSRCCPVGTAQMGCVANLPCRCDSIYRDFHQIPRWHTCLKVQKKQSACLPEKRPARCRWATWSAVTRFFTGFFNAGKSRHLQRCLP